MIEEITSRTNKKIQRLVSLQKEKNRQEEGVFVDEGFKNLMMALQYGNVKEIYTVKPFSLDNPDIQIYKITEEILDKISLNKNSDGFVFVSEIPQYEIENFIRIIYLDDIQDPGNVGTIIRTALAFGMDGVVLGKGCASIYNNKTLAACKGAYYKIPVISMDFKQLKTKLNVETKIVSTTLNNRSIDLEECPRFFSFVIVLGNEGNGVKQEIQESSDVCVKIPIINIDSLNVAVAGGIVMNYFA